MVDALGYPLTFILTGGQRQDITQALALLDGWCSDHVIADKGYDAETFLAIIADMGAVAVIPPKKNRKEMRTYDTHLHKERHLVECCINKLKQFRRIFSRYEKLDVRYLGFLAFAATLIWLR